MRVLRGEVKKNLSVSCISIVMATLPIAQVSAADGMSVVSGLQRLLSATISMTSSAQSAHWNVTGPNFSELHSLFGSHYDELFGAQDVLAERMRALRAFPLAECAGTPVLKPPFLASEALTRLLADREGAIVAFKEVARIARESGDTVTENMLLTMIEAHQKAAWMLRSFLT